MTSVQIMTNHNSNDRNVGPEGPRTTEPDSEDPRLDRRGFLTWLTRGSLAAATVTATWQILRFLAYEPPSQITDIYPIGPVSSFPLNSVTYIPDARVYVRRDREGLYAMDAVCTHLGCLVQQGEDGGFVCPCHNSAFDVQGNALNGPATKPLRFLHLSLDQDSVLTVDRSQAVEPSTRLAV